MSLDVRGALVDPTDFIGRDELVRRLLEAIGRPSPESVQVTGPRRSGKTWLLSRLKQEMHRSPPEKCVLIWQDMAQVGPSTPQRFYRRLFAEVRRQAPDGLGEVLEDPADDASDAFDQLKDFLDGMATSGLHTLFVMDEFERVARNTAFDLHFFGQWRSIAEGASTAMIVAAPVPLGELCHEAARGSPFWNVFSRVPVRPWSADEARLALGRWCRPDLTESLVLQVMKVTAGWPFAVKALMNALPRGPSMISSGEIDAAQAAFATALAPDVHAALVEATGSDPQSSSLFHQLCEAQTQGRPLTRHEVPPEHALERWGLVRREGGNVWPTWPGVVPAEVAPGDGWRADMLFASGIPGHAELQRLATHALDAAALGGGQVVQIIKKMIAGLGHDNDDLFRNARDLCQVLLAQIVPKVPQVAGLTDRNSQMTKLQDIANGEAGPRSPFDPVLARAIWALHHAGNHGSHDPLRAWEPSDLEGLSLVLQAIETARRADTWKPPRRT